MRRSMVVKATLATLFFASVPACVRVMEMDSYALGVWRLSMAAVGMTVILRLQRRTSFATILAEAQRHWRVLAAVGVCFGLHWLTYFQSIKLGSASIGALSFSTCGVQMPLLGWALGLGRPRAAAMAGVALAMAGSVLSIPLEDAAERQTLGFVIGVFSGTLYALVPIIHQRFARIDNELRTWGQFVFALPVFLATAPAAEWTLAPGDVWLVLYLGLAVNLIGHYLWVQLSTELPLSTTSALGYIQLPTSLAMNWLLVGERFTTPMILGAACIVAGNVLALGRRSEEAEAMVEGP